MEEEYVEVTKKIKVAKVSTTTVNSQGATSSTIKTVIPVAVREILKLQPKDKLDWVVSKNSVKIRKHEE